MAMTKKSKKVNIFDDDISIDAAKTIIQSSALDLGDDDDEEINWDGTPVVKYNNANISDTAKPPMPDMSNLALPSAPRTTTTTPKPSQQPISKSGYGGYNNAFAFGHKRSSSFTIEQKGMRDLQEGSMSSPNSSKSSSSKDLWDNVSESGRRQPTASDIDDLQQEVQSLRRSLLAAKRDRWVKLPVEDTLRRILKGEAYSFELYRSLADKLELLDSALRANDGNAITAVVLFMKKTTSSQIFSGELKKRPKAANHYLHYLKEHFEFAEYIDILCLMGRTEEAGIFKFKLAVSTKDVHLKITKLRDSSRAYFSTDASLLYDSSLVQEYVDLLERQRPIEESDAKAEAAGKSQLFKDFPRKRSLVDMSVVTTLYYCSLYHFHLAENSLGSPVAIQKRHQMSEKQYAWTAISARAKLHQWKDIESILTTKGWFGGTKLKAVIGYDKIVGILHRNSASPDILDKYLAMMSDTDARLNLAKKVNCHKAVIDTYAALKDRASLESYASKLDRYSKEGLYALDMLNGSLIKWR